MSMELKPFRIGHLKIDFPVILAGLAGYSDLPYRLICRTLGAPYCTTEMMLDKQMLTTGKLRRRLVRLTDEDHPIAGQIIGNDPGMMAEAAGELCKGGFDVIDLNFACPTRKVLARRRGGYLMSRPEKAAEIIRAVISQTDRPVSLKLRYAFREDDEDKSDFWKIVETAFKAGTSAICVHARSVEAKYATSADWEFIASVKQRFPDKTIIGSGDVLTPADALRMLKVTDVDAVSVARGAIGNPWFFRQVRDLVAGREPHKPGIAEQRELLLRHFNDACKLYGHKRAPKIMRKFGIKYARMHPQPSRLRASFVAVAKPADWYTVVENFYGDEDKISLLAPDVGPS